MIIRIIIWEICRNKKIKTQKKHLIINYINRKISTCILYILNKILYKLLVSWLNSQSSSYTQRVKKKIGEYIYIYICNLPYVIYVIYKHKLFTIIE